MQNRSIRNLWGRALGVLLLVLVSSAPVAAATQWATAEARGTVFSLVGGKWEEVAKGQELSGEQVIRTLQSGRLQLDGPNGRIELGGGTAIRLNEASVIQFSGSVTVEATMGGSLTVTANAVVATINGKATLRFDGADVLIKVTAGTVAVADASRGQTVDLVAGQSLEASDAGMLTAGTAGDAARSGNASGGNPNASPVAGSNGNAGGNGNGNGNSGGNSGGGNSGGNGNAGSNGNGNAGGNGNGNGNGNGG